MTIYEIAELTGYSIATVSRVLNGHDNVKESTRQRIQEAVSKTGYTPNLIARDLTTRKNRTVGLVLPGINSYFSPAVESITRRVMTEGGHVLITSNPSGGWNVGDEVDSLKLLLSKRVQGVIFFASRILPEHHRIFETWPQDVALVTVNDMAPELGVSSVMPDAEPGYRELFSHLVSRGKRNVAFIDGPQMNRNAGDRRQIRERILGEYPLETRGSWIKEGTFSLGSGAELTTDLLDEGGFDTLVCANDFMALGALQTLKARGLRVPEDISLAGYDDLEIAGYSFPALSTISQPSLDLGMAALDLILEEWEAGNRLSRSVVIRSKLIIRGSC